ncbi:MAG: NAD(P)H-hydrate dehydratase [bacterium JZ-2024 1]
MRLRESTFGVVTTAQMREMDRQGCEEFGMRMETMMENAGRSVADAVERVTAKRAGTVVVIAGPGNNGGDGICAGRWLTLRGKSAVVVLLGRDEAYSGEAGVHLKWAKECGVNLVNAKSAEEIEAGCGDGAIACIVDAVFGVGLKRPPEGLFAGAIEWMNRQKSEKGVPIVAVDIPSGVEGDTGRVPGVAVRADMTVTMQAPKMGLLLYPGAEYAGEVEVAPLGYRVRRKTEDEVVAPGRDWMKAHLPVWKKTIHKGRRGRVAIIGGSNGMTGAVILAGSAATKSGAGLVQVVVPKTLELPLHLSLVECLKRGVEDQGAGAFPESAYGELLEVARWASAVAIGPGIGRSGETVRLVRRLLEALKDERMVVDADALYALAGQDVQFGDDVVLTPHSGEMARLLGCSAEDVEQDRVGAVRMAAQKFGGVVVLKGARSLVAERHGKVRINLTGTEALATGGSGDVLTGIVGALLAQGNTGVEAATLGAFLHGLLGEMAQDALGSRSVTAVDLLRLIPRAIQEVIRE